MQKQEDCVSMGVGREVRREFELAGSSIEGFTNCHRGGYRWAEAMRIMLPSGSVTEIISTVVVLPVPSVAAALARLKATCWRVSCAAALSRFGELMMMLDF